MIPSRAFRLQASHFQASRLTVPACVAALTMLCSPAATVSQTHAQTRPLPLSQPRPDASAVESWKARRFGMFIHFGLYSELGGMWQGRQIDNGYSEQIMANAPVPKESYELLARTFNPTKFDADAIVALAKSAGMRFIVVTAKHHDGFAMFGTRQSHFNIVDATPFHRDVVKELAAACARGGLKFGVYYSTIDWNAPTGSPYVEGNSNVISDAHAAFNAAQLRELLTGYGPLSEIWFDMGKPTPEQSRLFAETVHSLQRDTMVSGRVFNYQGDFTVMGDNEVPHFVIDEPWQTPASIFHDTWGYRSWEQRGAPEAKVHEKLMELVTVASRGGNYILNIGPQGDGAVVPFEADVLHGIGTWLKRNGEAVFGTGGTPPSASPFRALGFGFATVTRNRLYLFVRDVPSDGRLQLPGLQPGIRFGAPFILGSRSPAGQVVDSPTGTEVKIDPASLRGSGFLPVIAIPYTGMLNVRSSTTVAAQAGELTLEPEKADRFLNYNGRGYEAPATLYKLQWQVEAPAGHYMAEVTYTRSEAQAKSDEIDLVTGGRLVRIRTEQGTADATWHGELLLSGGDTTVEVTPAEPFLKGTALPVTLRRIHLRRLP